MAPPFVPPAPEGRASFAEIWSPPYRTRTVMMSVFQFCQTIGFYGFAAWVPTLPVAKGIDVTTSPGVSVPPLSGYAPAS